MEDAEKVALGIALEGAAGMPGGFSTEEVAEIEAAWSHVDADLATYGFVLRLQAGPRRYLELTLDDIVEKGEAEIELVELDGTAGLPDLDDADWADDVSHLNERLAELKRQ